MDIRSRTSGAYAQRNIVSSQHVVRECPDIATSSEDYARRFSGPAGEYFLDVQDRAVRQALAHGPARTVLDVGGGHGQIAPGLASTGHEVTIFGSDNLCFDRLRSAEPPPLCALVTGDLLKLPFGNSSFDVVIALRLISHIEAWPTLIAELCRVSRRSVILEYPSLISINAIGPLLFNLKKHIEGNTRSYRSFFLRELRGAFETSGFRVTACYPQFVLPMVLHRAIRGARFLQKLEKMLDTMKLTRLLGSPVILRCDRLQG